MKYTYTISTKIYHHYVQGNSIPHPTHPPFSTILKWIVTHVPIGVFRAVVDNRIRVSVFGPRIKSFSPFVDSTIALSGDRFPPRGILLMFENLCCFCPTLRAIFFGKKVDLPKLFRESKTRRVIKLEHILFIFVIYIWVACCLD